MLLDQSLAICFSTSIDGNSLADEEEDGGDDEDEEEEEGKYRLRRRREAPTKDDQLALKLFRKIVSRNRARPREEPRNKETFKIHARSSLAKCSETTSELLSLGEALEQVNFSGFIVPSWLLVSGPIKALQAIRLAWLEGRLKSPLGYRIKTIGKYRN